MSGSVGFGLVLSFGFVLSCFMFSFADFFPLVHSVQLTSYFLQHQFSLTNFHHLCVAVVICQIVFIPLLFFYPSLQPCSHIWQEGYQNIILHYFILHFTGNQCLPAPINYLMRKIKKRPLPLICFKWQTYGNIRNQVIWLFVSLKFVEAFN